MSRSITKSRFVCPSWVSFEDGGQGDVYQDCQKLNDEEVLMESVSYSQRGNEDNQAPPPSAYSGFPRGTEMQLFPSLTQPVNYMKPESYGGTVSWEEYISHFNDCAELSRLTNRQKVLFIAASLRDQARTFYISLSLAERRSFDSLINKFSQRFGNADIRTNGCPSLNPVDDRMVKVLLPSVMTSDKWCRKHTVT